ncbi:hypothetical protein [Nonomuraea bangladeshensis]|uniref:hypothetical protein n=1 Tax=Nonomuraea bangladeshensis TaxID=404385 RepID=UPI0031E1E1CF
MAHGAPAEGRRTNFFFVPVAKTQKGNALAELDLPELGPTGNRIKQNHFINAIRRKANGWRLREHPNITATSLRLLEHWSDPTRNSRALFCQR